MATETVKIVYRADGGFEFSFPNLSDERAEEVLSTAFIPVSEQVETFIQGIIERAGGSLSEGGIAYLPVEYKP